MLYFITGNKNKFSEVKAIIKDIEQLNIDLPELQEIDPYKIIEAKLIEARKHHDGEFIVEDTSLYMDCLNGLPGPLIKWFLEKLGNEGIFEIAKKFNNYKVTAKTLIGYGDSSGEIRFFEGNLEGKIIKPEVESDFGWAPIFCPNGYNCSFAELSIEERNKMSMRGQALAKLKDFLDNKK
ncbi:non-canonical purine NTP pyrophosphatase [Candidatus Gracilibacteria bacterium]|nr:non-canonical purine NTP pyrophosphatase [Candidatus Gracilibacteria bacterium]